jgi:FkbM family methyltransferase
MKSKIRTDDYLRYSQWRDVAHEVFKRYGRFKKEIKRRMNIEQAGDMVRVEIDGRVIYWPAEADVARLVDMYFEVYNENNNHRFDIPEMRVKAGDVVIDCGACEGYFSLKALESGAAKVYCIEPGDAITKCLHKSFAPDVRAGKVLIYSYLIGEKNEAVRFYDNPSDPTVCQMCHQDQEIISDACLQNKEMLTIDEICLKHSINKVDFIKADVEGGEVGLVYGAEKTIRIFQPNLAIAVYHAPENANLIVDFIEKLSLNYKIRVKGIVDFDGVPRPVMVHCYHVH